MSGTTWCAAVIVVLFSLSPVLAVPAANLSIEPSSPTIVEEAIGESVAFQVWLRNISDPQNNKIQSVELDFGTLPAAWRLVAGTGAADGFLENSPTIPALLDTTLDGSLVDGHTAGLPDLSYVAFSTAGIPTGSDVLLGTFWVQLQSGATGPYTLSLNNSSTSILSSTASSYSLSYTNAQIAVPEPASIATVLLGAGVLLASRRRGS